MRIALCAGWLIAAGVGFAIMSNYQNTAGRVGQTPDRWPAQAAVSPDARRATLLMFAHPQCPCTRASMEELNRLLARCGDRIAAHVLFLQPEELPADWPQSALWRSAADIPGVTVHEDPKGEQARQFGAETSGFVVLFSPRGELLFQGGITAARGHAGDNLGANLIASLLDGKSVNQDQTPVYGCGLRNGCGTSTERSSVCFK